MPKKTQPQTAPRPVRRNHNGLIKCRICRCTQLDACEGGCSWVDDDLCSTCDTVVQALKVYIWTAHRVWKGGVWMEAYEQLDREAR